MRIYSMTATFGKLAHQTLTFEPGLNVIHAPNEWGKSTWCAFLVNMLYGIDTKQRASGSNLPDKERYAPWSGLPMAGRIDLNWNGRDITIERSTKGRLLLGVFRAFETKTGLDIPELDGTNCGKMLLGVERSVFTRSCFIRLNDMPVTADDALRRRLNALVSTGDDSGEADRLGTALRDLKNKCRFNNSGLLPQAEMDREQLRRQLDQIIDLKTRSCQLEQRQDYLSQRIQELDNHETTLRYNAAKEDSAKVERANDGVASAAQSVEALERQLESLPDPTQAVTALDAGRQLQKDLEALELEQKLLPPCPEPPMVPAHFENILPQQAVILSRTHVQKNAQLKTAFTKSKRLFGVLAVLAVLFALAALVCFLLEQPLFALCGGGISALLLMLTVMTAVKKSGLRKELQELADAHPGIPPQRWEEDAQNYLNRQMAYQQALNEYDTRKEDLQRRGQLLNRQITLFTGEGSLEQRLTQWQTALQTQQKLDAARLELQTRQTYLETVKSMVRTVTSPAMPDKLDLPLEQTLRELADARAELQQTQQQLYQYKGKAEALGQEQVLRARLDTLLRRISRLEDTYYALELAQDALYRATTELQRRFAPRIAKKAQELFASLTDGRYNRLVMAEDFSLSVSAQEEDTLHTAQWRSDGTVDQLYLALRLAVADELTPEAPLVLDDALLRFDDKRLGNAMDLLQAENKQVILFTCQSREADYINK